MVEIWCCAWFARAASRKRRIISYLFSEHLRRLNGTVAPFMMAALFSLLCPRLSHNPVSAAFLLLLAEVHKVVLRFCLVK